MSAVDSHTSLGLSDVQGDSAPGLGGMGGPAMVGGRRRKSRRGSTKGGKRRTGKRRTGRKGRKGRRSKKYSMY